MYAGVCNKICDLLEGNRAYEHASFLWILISNISNFIGYLMYLFAHVKMGVMTLKQIFVKNWFNSTGPKVKPLHFLISLSGKTDTLPSHSPWHSPISHYFMGAFSIIQTIAVGCVLIFYAIINTKQGVLNHSCHTGLKKHQSLFSYLTKWNLPLVWIDFNLEKSMAPECFLCLN